MLLPFKIFSYVVGKAHPAEICRRVVLLVPVDVVHRGIVFWVWIVAERRRHKTAHKVMPGLSVPAQCYSWIAFVVGESSQNPGLPVFQALDTAHVADKVFPAVALDLPPFFAGQVFYSIHWVSPLS